MNRTVTIKEEIFVERPPEMVWDFTQDYARRHEWDGSIARAKVVRETPERVVEVHGHGWRWAFHYKLNRRPERTSLVMADVRPRWIGIGGGGSWTYQEQGGGTLWTQTNTLTLPPIIAPFLPIVTRYLRRATRRSMLAAKEMMENPG